MTRITARQSLPRITLAPSRRDQREAAIAALTDITHTLRDEAALARAANELRHRWGWVA